MANKITNFTDWFDPNNLEHIRAYKHLSTVGTWPEGFIPDYVVLGPTWIFEATAKLAAEFVLHILPLDEGKENQ